MLTNSRATLSIYYNNNATLDDSQFVLAEHPEKQNFFKAPQPPRHFHPQHKPQPIILSHELPEFDKAFNTLNPLQKAVFLGDRSGSIMELLSSQDRQKLQLLTKKNEYETKVKKKVGYKLYSQILILFIFSLRKSESK